MSRVLLLFAIMWSSAAVAEPGSATGGATVRSAFGMKHCGTARGQLPGLCSLSETGSTSSGQIFSDSASALLEDGIPTSRASATPGGYAVGFTTYQFEVTGPANKYVDVNVIGTVSVTGLASSSAVAGAYISYYDFSRNIFQSICSGINTALQNCQGINSSFVGSMSFSVLTNTPSTINVFATADARTVTYGSVAYTAFADPYIFLKDKDSSYSLNFSPGVLNAPEVPNVPEPPSLTLMIAGALLLYSVSRKKLLMQ